MKDTGIEWIGQIPEDWNMSKIKYECTSLSGFTPNTKNEEYYTNNLNNIWITIENINKDINNQKKISDIYIKKYKPKIIPKNSLLYSFKLTVGKTRILETDAYINEAIIALNPKHENININFIKWASILIKYNAIKNIYDANLLNKERINNAAITIPSIKEQNLIANFLDKKCTAIDQYTDGLKKEISDLKEYQKSLIFETVTKGLDKNVPLKDTGIEWIDQIPEHWNMSKIKYKFDIISGSTPDTNNYNYYNGETTINWLTPANMPTFAELTNVNKQITPLAVKKANLKIIQKNNIIISSRAPVGKIVYNKIPTTINQGCKAIIKKEHSKYYYFYLYTTKDILNLYSQGTTFKEINVTNLNKIPIPVPPIKEQEKIAEFLDKKCSAIDKLIEIYETEINDYEEYKKSLIYEYVTGKKRLI